MIGEEPFTDQYIIGKETVMEINQPLCFDPFRFKRPIRYTGEDVR